MCKVETSAISNGENSYFNLQLDKPQLCNYFEYKLFSTYISLHLKYLFTYKYDANLKIVIYGF